MDYNMDNYPKIQRNETRNELLERVNAWGKGFEKQMIERLKIALKNQKESQLHEERHCDVAFQSGRMWEQRAVLGKKIPVELEAKKS